ncbi:carbamoyl-phosphate synthase large subunit [Thermodesulfovibrionales bacterium]|nr:carbamoyl-phosphate synthase large subunit [Thermodesulfovibrionales bacterium]
MPKRTDIKKILLIGSGPIVIGQACEFDYSGTQACKALREEGYSVVLVNSNPATIMTDPEMADATYIEPLSSNMLELLIKKERPEAILPTMGGQTALNLAVELSETGILDKYGVELIGAKLHAIKKAEDRELFKAAIKKIGLEVPESEAVTSINDGIKIIERIGLPAILRPAFTLGGAGGGIAYNIEEYRELLGKALKLSPTNQVLVEESVLGWKEYELEVMRDMADNVVIVCTIENLDPMGVHTGDSITVAPAQTLTDKEYQRMRDAAIAIIREIGIDTGGSNIQFAVNPEDGKMVVIEMNPRVSRSSALASKATGFPIAKIAARLIDKKPLFGICLGHQILGLAMGGRTYKLKFGHHGSNHPVKDLSTGRVEITSQNHNYCVDINSLHGQVRLTHRNLYDGTEEGMQHVDLPVFSVQHHPEAGPGPNDSTHLFRKFMESV